jgi:uncharacterized protein YqgC (DUF456 family)
VETILLWTLVVLFAVFGVVCLLLVVVGLPGTWVLLAGAVGLELLDGPLLLRGGPGVVSTFGWRLLLVAAGLALVGEVVEFLAGAAGTKLGGGTRRGMWGALAGGLLGAVVLTPALPVPLLGTLVGALAGTFAGAFIAEVTGPEARAHRHTVRAALAAVAGRLAGTVGKLAAGVVLWLLLVRALLPGG